MRGGAAEEQSTQAARVTVAWWNTRGLNAGCTGDVTEQTLEWMDGRIAEARPLVVGLIEVVGGLQEMRVLRKWWARRRFDMVWLPSTHRNAVVCAVDRTRARLTRHTRLAPRVIAVRVRVADVRDPLRLAVVHGAHEPSHCGAQIRAVEAWAARGGGTLLGDLNHVPCSTWRARGGTLDGADRAIRQLLAAPCACCNGGAALTGGEGGEWLHVDQRRALACGLWTHFHTDGRWGHANARYDYALRTEAAPRWSVSASIPVERVSPDCDAVPLSDHLWQEMSAALPTPVAPRAARPRAPRLDGVHGELLAQEIADELRDGGGVDDTVVQGLGVAYVRGTPASDEVTSRAVRAVERAERRLRVMRADARMRERSSSGAPTSPRRLFYTWRERLRQVARARGSGLRPDAARHLAVFHPMAGLRKYVVTDGDGWRLVMRRCRHEMNRAASLMHAEGDREDTWTARMAARAQRVPADDAQAQLRIAAAIVKGARGSTAHEEFREGDVEGGRVVHSMDPDAAAVAADIGRACVDALDDGAVPAAYQAMSDKYAGRWPTLQGRLGGRFLLSKELTFTDFEAVIDGAPSKAVGKSGLALRTLKLAGPRVRRALFDALVADVGRRSVSARWREVLMVLLPKPPPNRAHIVRECREIALTEHDVKALLLMVRRACFARVMNRVSSIQSGWVPGYGCDITGVASAFVTDSARRLRRSMWMLYVDLSQFFPRIHRGCLTIADLAKGLPPEVVWLAGAIYGSERPDDTNVARCYYDSAGGLCGGFDYRVGVLMGCPLSTDQARIFLDCLVRAIAAAARGVRLWGTGRTVAQLLLADDWLGVYSDPEQLRVAWAWWRAWEPLAGARLGISTKHATAADKTIVTGVRYGADGRAHDIVDPGLTTTEGRRVPCRPRTHAYKHLGRWRRADADRSNGLAQFSKRIRAGVRRLQRLRSPTPYTLLLVSEAIIGGYAGFYLQDLYLTFPEADKLEAGWRRVYNRVAHRDRSTPRADIYDVQFKAGSSRRHLWSQGLQAVFCSVNTMLADAEDMEHRAAARSGVALSLFTWGCRQDPALWDWRHLREQLEDYLSRTKCRYVGDAWMLAWAVLMEADAGGAINAESTFEAVTQHWRWVHAPQADNPMAASAAHFAPTVTPAVTTATGVPPPWPLAHAGYVAVGHFVDPTRAAGGDYMDFERAAERDGRLLKIIGAKACWQSVVHRLRGAQLAAVSHEPVRTAASFDTDAQRMPNEEQWRLALQSPHVAADRRGHTLRGCTGAVDRRALERLGDELAASRGCATGRDCAYWRRRFDGVQRTAMPDMYEWRHGAPTLDERAQDAHMVFELDRERVRRSGGELRWLSHNTDEHGHLVGWEEAAAALLDVFSLNEEGYLARDGETVTAAELHLLPVMLQLFARARLALADAPVVNEGVNTKQRRTRINLTAAWASLHEACRLQAQYDPTHAYAVDGTKVERTGANGETFIAVARAAVAHDGSRIAGRMKHSDAFLGEENTTYLAEKAAVNDALVGLPHGARVVIWLDATSPAHAMSSFIRSTARRRQQRYAAGWHGATMAAARPLEVVVMHWQTSHVGEPMNEWADVAAGEAAEADQVLEVVRPQNDHVSMIFPSTTRGSRAWAGLRADAAVASRLRACSAHTVFRQEGDLRLGGLSSRAGQTLAAVRAQRLLVTDPRRQLTCYQRVRLTELKCPWCDALAPDWMHFCFECQSPTAKELRGPVRAALSEIQQANDQTTSAAFVDVRMAKEWFPRYYATVFSDPHPCRTAPGKATRWRAQRVFGGLYGFDKPPASVARVAAEALALACVEMWQVVADACAHAWGAWLRELRLVERVFGRYSVRLKSLVVEGGPERAAALRDFEVLRRRLGTGPQDGWLDQWRTGRAHVRGNRVTPTYATRKRLVYAQSADASARAARDRAPGHRPRAEGAAAAAASLAEARAAHAGALENLRRMRGRWAIAASLARAWSRARQRLSTEDRPVQSRLELTTLRLTGLRASPPAPLTRAACIARAIACTLSAVWRARRARARTVSPEAGDRVGMRAAQRRWLEGGTVHGGAPLDGDGDVHVEIAPNRRARRGSKRARQEVANARVARGWDVDRADAWAGAQIVDTRRRATRGGLSIEALIRWPGTWVEEDGSWRQTALEGSFERWLVVNAAHFPHEDFRKEAWAAYHQMYDSPTGAEERELRRLEGRVRHAPVRDPRGRTRGAAASGGGGGRSDDRSPDGSRSRSRSADRGPHGGDATAAAAAEEVEMASASGDSSEVDRSACDGDEGGDMDDTTRHGGTRDPLRIGISVVVGGVNEALYEGFCHAEEIPDGLNFHCMFSRHVMHHITDVNRHGQTALDRTTVTLADGARSVVCVRRNTEAVDEYVARGIAQITFRLRLCGNVSTSRDAAGADGSSSMEVDEEAGHGGGAPRGADSVPGVGGDQERAEEAGAVDDGEDADEEIIAGEGAGEAPAPWRATGAAGADDDPASAAAAARALRRNLNQRRADAHLHRCRMSALPGCTRELAGRAARDLRAAQRAIELVTDALDPLRSMQASTIERYTALCPGCAAPLSYAICLRCTRQVLGVPPYVREVPLGVFCVRPTEHALDELLVDGDVRGNGSCWTYSVLAAASLVPHCASAGGIPLRDASAAPVTDAEHSSDALLRGAIARWIEANGGAARFYGTHTMADGRLVTPDEQLDCMRHGAPHLSATGEGVFGGEVEFVALADLLGCVILTRREGSERGVCFEPGVHAQGRGLQRPSTLTAAVEVAIVTRRPLLVVRFYPPMHWHAMHLCDDGGAMIERANIAARMRAVLDGEAAASAAM